MALLTENLLSFQFEAYPAAHGDRRNLLIHALTEPLFVFGVLSIPGAIAAGRPLGALGGLAGMLFAVLAQGRGHKLEVKPPAPFASPLDIVARLFAEQFITFPRFVLSGGYGRAWRDAKRAD
jgi:hypothetical protein